LDSGRLEAFSDGVFAVAITILALNLAVPGPGHGPLAAQLAGHWPSFAAYVVSFLTIGIIWVNHHTLFKNFARIDRTLLFLNLLLLLLLFSSLPFRSPPQPSPPTPAALARRRIPRRRGLSGGLGGHVAQLRHAVSLVYLAQALEDRPHAVRGPGREHPVRRRQHRLPRGHRSRLPQRARLAAYQGVRK